jgi:hypothetical protein
MSIATQQATTADAPSIVWLEQLNTPNLGPIVIDVALPRQVLDIV